MSDVGIIQRHNPTLSRRSIESVTSEYDAFMPTMRRSFSKKRKSFDNKVR